ncbi:MAG: transcription-repair coupling factor [Simkaniaceae bacterium]|nr:transcription-repair coupling factor [Simkaniaceae bacterium]
MPSPLSYPLYELLQDAEKAKLITDWVKREKRSVLVISDSSQLYEDIKFFYKEGVHLFPAWETLPEESIAPSPDIVGRRLEILHALAEHQKPQIILTSLQGALQGVPGKKTEWFLFKVGDSAPFSSIPELLTELGYKRRAVAADKGDFAIRGGIIDVFPLSAFDPVRIDFFDDVIDSIRTYDPVSQKSTGKVASIFIPPAFERSECSLLDYLKDPLVVFDDLLKIEDQMVALKSLPFHPFYEKTKDKLFFASHHLESLEMFNRPLPAERTPSPFLKILSLDLLSEYKEVFLIAGSEGEEKTLRAIAPPHAIFVRGYLSSGFIEKETLYYPYSEHTGRHKLVRNKWRNTYHTPPSDFHELKGGDLVVHFHHGIGKYLGIEKQINHLGQETEFMIIEYAEGGKFFAPLSQAHLVSRYIGHEGESIQLHKLGTTKWHQAKVKVQTAIVGYAQDLLEWQANREVSGGFAYPPDGEDVTLFEEEFPFVETQDQLNATADIKADMERDKAMDRLLLGDVGYGKTEVAMRAAFKAVMDGHKQVAVLVPTTVLAMQHYESFKERMRDFPIRIGVLSRFVKAKEAKKTVEEAKAGSIDIIIGTHKLISRDLSFANLGLIIIDEEQRFGVRAKEHLKQLKVGVDTLTLSATPIPRTLYFSLIGARDLSVINTPPQDRLPIKTLIAERDDALIQNGITREMSHSGQVYFIHNRVESIYQTAEILEKLMPKARVAVVHGQMDPEGIDEIFHAFKQGQVDILVATTIVESGIDIPNANTIFIDRADTYGLADLYQLRGRVGRWNRPAYAYFLVPKNRSLSEISRKRLDALAETSGFGGGMKLAMRDLEIRGSGDILGVKQSGHVSSIGFHLYCKLLKRTIDALKKNQAPSFLETRLEFTFDATLPKSYIEETSLRIEIYHRLGETTELQEVDLIFAELKDRFGPPPPPALWLYHMTRIRIAASKRGVSLIRFDQNSLTIEKDKISHRLLYALPQDPSKLETDVISKLPSK